MVDLHLIGIKSICETSNGFSVSCFVDPVQVKTATINCENSYYNEHNITQQKINCMNNGTWSEEPIECISQCTDTPKTLKLIKKNKLNFPTAYAEIVRKSRVEGKPNSYPVIIITERKVATKFKYLQNENLHDFIIRIYKSKTNFIDHTFYSTYCNDYAVDKHEAFCLLYVSLSEFIKYDEKTRPICQNIIDLPEFSQTLFLKNEFGTRVYNEPDTSGACYVPSVDKKRIDLQCYDTLPNYVYPPIECSKRAYLITKRCQIGYKNKKLNNNSHNRRDLVSRCNSNRWTVFGYDHDCEMVCGQIDKNYKPVFTHLLYKGSKNDITSAPWHVGIYTKNTEEDTTDFQQICGGSIIHSNVVISAGHCFYNVAYGKLFDASYYMVTAGKRYRSYDVSEPFERFSTIKEIHIPTTYVHQPVSNDIAILVLNQHFEYNTHIKPICIDWEPRNENNIDEGINGYVVGWGATSSNDSSSTELLAVNFTTLANKQCRRLVDPNYRSEISGDKFCATNDEKASACQGDSGGGFVIRKEAERDDYRYFLAGVVSLGVDATKYCSDGFLTVFTNIQTYKELIKRVIAETRHVEFGGG